MELVYAARNGEIETVKELVEKGANIKAKTNYGWTALMEASRRGHLDVVEFLIERGVNIETKNINGETVLMWASHWGRLEVVKLLVENGADQEIVYEKFLKVYKELFPHSDPTRETEKTIEKIIKEWYNTKWDYTQELDIQNSNYKKIEKYVDDIEFIFDTCCENFIVDLTLIFRWHNNNRLF